MELYVGGSFQGKLQYVLNKKSWEASSKLIQEWSLEDIENGRIGKRADCFAQLAKSDAGVQNHFHNWVALAIQQEKSLEEIIAAVKSFCAAHTDAVIICDEVGSGIVPIEQDKRIYREYVGRVLCVVAEKAEHMERIVCGMGQVIK